MGRWLAAAAVVGGFVAILVFVAVGVRPADVDVRLLHWQVVGPDRVDLRLDVRRSGTAPADQPVTCVIRAQDRDHIDVAYATVSVPAGPAEVAVDYSLRTLAPAVVVEVLACSTDGPPRDVPPPQFPIGVVPPEQPF